MSASFTEPGAERADHGQVVLVERRVGDAMVTDYALSTARRDSALGAGERGMAA